MNARTRFAATLTAALLAAGSALAGPAAADDYPSLDEIMYEGPVNDALMPVGDVLELVDPTGLDEQEGEDEVLTAPAGQDDAAELDTAPPSKNKGPWEALTSPAA